MADTCCWICLEEEGPLTQPCACPRHVHRLCLARWQLQKTGSDEEHRCRFCSQPYGDWRDQRVPATDCCSTGGAKLQLGAPVELVVAVKGSVCRVMATPGPLGKAVLIWQVSRRFGLPMFQNGLDISFRCRMPWSPDDEAWLPGINAFDAAVHCAAAHAEQRPIHQRGQEALRRCDDRHKPLWLQRQDQEQQPERLRRAAGVADVAGSGAGSSQGGFVPGGSSHEDPGDADEDPGMMFVGSFPLHPVRLRVFSSTL